MSERDVLAARIEDFIRDMGFVPASQLQATTERLGEAEGLLDASFNAMVNRSPGSPLFATAIREIGFYDETRDGEGK